MTMLVLFYSVCDGEKKEGVLCNSTWQAYYVIILYSQICSSSYDLEAKYRAMMGMGTLVSYSVRQHSDKTGMMCSGTSE